MTRQDEMAGSQGTFSINDTNAVTDKKFYGIEVNADAVISELKINGGSTNVVDDYISTAATALSAGTKLRCSSDVYFSHIKLDSGKVTIWKTA